MEKQDLKNLIVEHVKNKTGRANVLKLVLAEFEKLEMAKAKVTTDQIVRKLIESNNECLSHRKDDALESENLFLKSLLPSYMSVAELRKELEPLGLDSSGASIGKAVKFLRANGLQFLPQDVKEALQ